jgi:AI-2 transport protein TqsA
MTISVGRAPRVDKGARLANDGATMSDGRDRGARVLFVAASVVVVIAGLRAAASILLPFLVAVFLAIVSMPLMTWLQRRGVPKVIAVVCTVLAGIAVLAGLVVLVGHSVNQFTAAAPRYQARFQTLFAAITAWAEARGVDTTAWVTLDLLNPGVLVDVMGTTLRAIAAVLQNAFLVLLTMIFILLEAAGFPRKLQVAFGRPVEELGRLSTMTREVQRYLGFKTLISLGTGVLVFIWVAVMGMDFPLLWGLAAFILNYIPNLGSILAAVPPVLLAIVQFGPGHAAVVGLGYLVINVSMSNFLEPNLMGRKLGLSTLVVFLSLVFWGWVWGPVGMLLAVPLTMILKIMLEHTEDFRWLAVLLGPAPPPRDPPALTPASAGRSTRRGAVPARARANGG